MILRLSWGINVMADKSLQKKQNKSNCSKNPFPNFFFCLALESLLMRFPCHCCAVSRVLHLKKKKKGHLINIGISIMKVRWSHNNGNPYTCKDSLYIETGPWFTGLWYHVVKGLNSMYNRVFISHHWQQLKFLWRVLFFPLPGQIFTTLT